MQSNLALSTKDWFEIKPEQGKGLADEQRRLRIAVVGELPGWLDEISPSLTELLELPENWDSYGARTIDEQAVLYALEFLEWAMGEGTPLPSIIPVNTGAVQIEWHSRGIDLEVEIEPSGCSHVMYVDQRLGHEWEGELEHPDYLPEKLIGCLEALAQRA